jgi:hypothetical protein
MAVGVVYCHAPAGFSGRLSLCGPGPGQSFAFDINRLNFQALKDADQMGGKSDSHVIFKDPDSLWKGMYRILYAVNSIVQLISIT